ncbi:MAG: BamA/TamA family outer membrane protein [Bacteroidia bacterium]|nr:BamA/TamA family outer membrane protein [Bacteroidia bacterium]
MYFRNNKARVYLYLKDRSVSSVDGILGLQSDRESGKVNLTGEIKLFLSNSFSRGEKLKFHWKQPRKLTQNLEVEVNYPFLFSTPFGLDAKLEIYKHDTTYLDLKQLIGVQYVFSGNNYLEAFVQYHNSTLLSTSNFSSLTVLPEWADINNTNYGLRLNIEKLDYKFNPRKGWLVDLSVAVGTKKIEQNSKISEELYDSLLLKSNQYQANLKANYFWNVYKRHVLNFGVNSAALLGDDIFSNQLYRIGGLKSLRGFDEESILATTYSILTIEYRYLLEQNAYFLLFANGAYYEAETRTGFVNDNPIGFGTGIAFETKLGIFNLNYAIGQQFNNPIFFRDAKLHFGIVNYF